MSPGPKARWTSIAAPMIFWSALHELVCSASSRLRGESCLCLRVSVVGVWVSCLQHAHFKFFHLRIQVGCFQGYDQGLPGFHGIDDLVQPQAGSAVTGVGLVIVSLFY